MVDGRPKRVATKLATFVATQCPADKCVDVGSVGEAPKPLKDCVVALRCAFSFNFALPRRGRGRQSYSRDGVTPQCTPIIHKWSQNGCEHLLPLSFRPRRIFSVANKNYRQFLFGCQGFCRREFVSRSFSSNGDPPRLSFTIKLSSFGHDDGTASSAVVNIVGTLTLTFVLVPQPVLTTSTYVVAWP